jgi:succinate dehydrogenase / fumarate reductase membrane anchor subunit
MVKRIVVGAHYGLRSFLAQRITAVAMALYTLLILGVLLVAPPAHYGDWRTLFAHQWMKLATFVFLVSLFLHAWVGMRDILMDYVKPTGWRLAAQVAVILLLIAYTGWSIQILWGA